MDAGEFADHLLDGEKIAWSGRPKGGLLFFRGDILIISFALLWGGPMFFGSPELPTRIWVALIVLFAIAGRFLLDAWVRSGMRYALTNKRFLIQRSAPFAKFTAINLNQSPNASLTESRNGRGTIRFGQTTPGIGWLAYSLDPTPQFLAIEDARSVFDLIQRTAQKAS